MDRSTPFNNSSRYLIHDHLKIHQEPQGQLHVFGIDNYNHLIHYLWEDANRWYAEDITELIGDNLKGRVNEDYTVFMNDSRMEIYFTDNGQLKRIFQKSVDYNLVWDFENISQIGEFTDYFVGTPSGYAKGGNPLVCVRSNTSLLHVVIT